MLCLNQTWLYIYFLIFNKHNVVHIMGQEEFSSFQLISSYIMDKEFSCHSLRTYFSQCDYGGSQQREPQKDTRLHIPFLSVSAAQEHRKSFPSQQKKIHCCGDQNWQVVVSRSFVKLAEPQWMCPTRALLFIQFEDYRISLMV